MGEKPPKPGFPAPDAGGKKFNCRIVRTRGETPLHRAAAYASEETVKFLLEAGADKTIRDANGDSPQSWASWHWRPKRLIDLLDPRDAT